MKVCILAYDHFAVHSVALLAYFLREAGVSVVCCSKKTGAVSTKEGFTVIADSDAASICAADCSGLIVPGGVTSSYVNASWIRKLIRDFETADAWICSICEGTILLAHSGVLSGKEFTSSFDFSGIPTIETGKNVKRAVVRSGKLITARGQAFTEFALTCLEAFGCVDRKELQRLYRRYDPPKYKITWELKKYGTHCP